MRRQKRLAVKVRLLAEAAIAEAIRAALEEGGAADVPRLLAIYKRGKVLPAPVVRRLERAAAPVARTA